MSECCGAWIIGRDVVGLVLKVRILLGLTNRSGYYRGLEGLENRSGCCWT